MSKTYTDCMWQDRSHMMWFPIRLDRYFIRNGRICCVHGLLSLKEHECQLYRILDISLETTFLNRLFGTGSIRMRTNDSSDPVLLIKNVKNARQVKDMISDLVEDARDERGIREREIKATSGRLEDVNGDGHVDINDYL